MSDPFISVPSTRRVDLPRWNGPRPEWWSRGVVGYTVTPDDLRHMLNGGGILIGPDPGSRPGFLVTARLADFAAELDL